LKFKDETKQTLWSLCTQILTTLEQVSFIHFQGPQVSTVPIKPNPSIISFRPCIKFFFQKSKYARKDIQKNQWITSPPPSLHIYTQPNTEEKRKEKEKKGKLGQGARLITKWALCECPLQAKKLPLPL
jgi:hypothetical protein